MKQAKFLEKVEKKYLKITGNHRTFYRGTNGVSKLEIKKGFFEGDGHFGSGMYLSPDSETAISYVDLDGDTPLLTTYEIDGNILVVKNNDPNNGIFNPNKDLTFNISPRSKITLKEQEDLGKTILKKGYDAVLLLGDYIDGGEQILIPKGSKAKVKVKEIENLKDD